MVWAPSVVRYAATHQAAPHIIMSPLPIPHAHWGVAALYDRSHAPFARRFNAAVTTLSANGTLAHISTAAGLEAL
jgi:hypothetical protein